MTCDYTTTRVGDKTYSISTKHNGVDVTFSVIVANDESEIPDLVAYHFDCLNRPQPNYQDAQATGNVNLQEIIAEQSTQIAELSARITALEGGN